MMRHLPKLMRLHKKLKRMLTNNLAQAEKFVRTMMSQTRQEDWH